MPQLNDCVFDDCLPKKPLNKQLNSSVFPKVLQCKRSVCVCVCVQSLSCRAFVLFVALQQSITHTRKIYAHGQGCCPSTVVLSIQDYCCCVCACVFVLQRSQRVLKVDWRLKLPPTTLSEPAAGQWLCVWEKENNSWHEPCSLPHAHCFHYIHCMYVCVLWDVSLLTLNVFLCHIFAFCRLHRLKTPWTFVILMPIYQSTQFNYGFCLEQ